MGRTTASQRKTELAVVIDPRSSLSLQHQLRQRLIDAMNRGVLRPGRKLPSSRQLAEQVGVSRNTVTLAYDALLAEGHLVSKPRSGIFVAEEVPQERVTTGRRGLLRTAATPARLASVTNGTDEYRRAPNWDQYPYPFLDGCVDASLVPTDEWREALRLAFAKQAISRWGTSEGEHDDPLFLDELRTKVLPSWGIGATPDEIVATASARHALFLATEALVQKNTPVVIGDGVDGALRRRLVERQANLLPIALGNEPSRALESIPTGAVLIVSAHQYAGLDASARERSRALLDIARERDALVIEFAPPPELKESRRASLSLRTLDPSGRVIFVSGLSSVAAFGSPPGFISGDARLCERVRELRRAVGSELSPGLQRAWSYFVGLGHYAAWMARANRVLQGRRTALRDALQHYLHKFVAIEGVVGGSAYRVVGPAEMNALELARAAAGLGVLVEPDEGSSRNVLRMGVTSVPKESIRAGVELLARLIRGDQRLGSRQLHEDPVRPLTGKALHRSLAGKTLLYNTVYGDPCTIHVRSDGALIGRAGYANEDCDTGRWWVEDGRWFRQWQHWAYGEALGLVTVIDGDQVRWFKSDGLLVDTALIVREKRRNSR